MSSISIVGGRSHPWQGQVGAFPSDHGLPAVTAVPALDPKGISDVRQGGGIGMKTLSLLEWPQRKPSTEEWGHHHPAPRAAVWYRDL